LGAQGNTISLGGGQGDVVTIGQGSNNHITVGNGNGDVVNDSAFGDTITLGNGLGDVVNAGANSTLGNGGDTVTAVSSLIHAGKGHDTFVLSGDFGQETITNFSPTDDNIVLAQAVFGNFGAMQSDIAQVGANAVITDPQNSGNVLTLTNVKTSSLRASDFHFV